MESKNKMKYRYLGKTGLEVSVIAFGAGDQSSQELVTSLVKKAYEQGINFFDTAELYGPKPGDYDTLLGNALKTLNAQREDYVVCTKVFFGVPFDQASKPNRRGLSRKHIIEGAKASIKRLQLDYVDIILAHQYDAHTPIEEICRAFDYLVNNGLAFYWGTSNWPADKIEQAIAICEKYLLVKPVADQPEYSMFVRDRIEKEYSNLFKDHGYGTTVWSPLASGVLTGKYNKEIPKDTRFSHPIFGFMVGKYLTPEKIDETRRIVTDLETVAKELGTTTAGLALAWVLKNPDVSTAIMGCSRPSQIEENIKALEVVDKITPEIEARIEGILKNQPAPGFDMRYFKQSAHRRVI